MAETTDLVDEFLRESTAAERLRLRRTRAIVVSVLAVVSALAVVALWFAVQTNRQASELEVAATRDAQQARDLEAAATTDAQQAQDLEVAATRDAQQARALEAAATTDAQRLIDLSTSEADALDAKATSEIRRQEAEDARTAAERQSQMALARQLAAQTTTSIDQQEAADLSLLLAVEALRATADHGLLPVVEADAALRRALDSAPLAILPHAAKVVAISFSPDDARLATVTEEGTARVWDATTGEQLAVLNAEGVPQDIVFGSDRALLVTRDDQGSTARLWDVTAEQPLHDLPHQDTIHNAVFNAQGTQLATASADGVARLWDTATGEPIFSLAHDGVDTVLFSADGRRLVTVGRGPVARLWDGTNGEELASQALPPFERIGNPVQFAFSPGGTHLAMVGSIASGSNPLGGLAVWEVTSEKVLELGTSRVLDIAFSPDGAQLAVSQFSASGPSESLLDTATGQGTLLARKGADVLSFNRDGALLALGTADVCSLWRMDPGEWLSDLRQEGTVGYAAFAPIGTRLAISSEDSVWIWGGEAWGSSTMLRHDGLFEHVEFSPDGSRVMTTNPDDSHSLWDARTGQEIAALPLGGYIYTQFSPDGSRLALYVNSTTHVFDTATGQELHTVHHADGVWVVALSPDSSRLVERDEEFTNRLVDTATGQELITLDYDEETTFNPQILFSPDGAWLISPGNRVAHVWDARTGDKLKSLRHDSEILRIHLSSDGRHVATASADSTVRLWDAKTGEMQTAIPGEKFPDVSFSPLGRWLVIRRFAPPTLDLWNIVTGASEEGLAVAFAPDDSVLALLTDDRTVRLLDGLTGEPLFVLEAVHPIKVDPFSAVGSIAVAPGGRRLAALSQDQDQVAYLWDPASGQKLADLIHDGRAEGLTFSPDGTRLVTTSSNATVRLWDAGSGQALSIARHEGEVHGIAFSRNGAWLAVSYHVPRGLGSESFAHVYRPNTNELAALACRTVDRNLSQDEWRQYLGEREYRPTCPGLPGPEETTVP